MAAKTSVVIENNTGEQSTAARLDAPADAQQQQRGTSRSNEGPKQPTQNDGRMSESVSSVQSVSSSSTALSSSLVELDCRVIDLVYRSWLQIMTIPDYANVVGELLFRKIFDLAPGAISMFSFGIEYDEDNRVPDSFFSLPVFRCHSSLVVKTLGIVIQGMHQPEDQADLEGLAETMHALGARHLCYGVHPAHYRVVGKAILHALESGFTALSVGPNPSAVRWTDELKAGWATTFDFVAAAMMGGAGRSLELTRIRRRDVERQKSAVLKLRVLSSSSGTARLVRGREVRSRRPPVSCMDRPPSMPISSASRDRPPTGSGSRTVRTAPKDDVKIDSCPRQPRRDSLSSFVQRSSYDRFAGTDVGGGGATTAPPQRAIRRFSRGN